MPINSVFDAMQATFGSLYVNDFTLYGRNYQVNLESEAPFREGRPTTCARSSSAPTAAR